MRQISLASTLALLIGLLAGCASAAQILDVKTGVTAATHPNVQPAGPSASTSPSTPLPPAPADQVTPSPLPGPEASMRKAFEDWAQVTGIPYRDVTVTTLDNDGYYATLEVAAWFRPSRNAAWEEQTAKAECKLVGSSWQCDGDLVFARTDAETKRQALLSATATAEAAAAAPVAEIGGVPIPGADFQKRVRFEKYAMENQLARLQELEQQFGNQGYFQSQIAELQATLASPLSLGSQTLDGMIEDRLIAKDAAVRGIGVSDEEVDQALNEEIANTRGLVTKSQATATATAAVAATATAAQWTPTPTATPDPNGAAAPIVATLDEPPPPAIVDEAVLAQGIADLEDVLAAGPGLSLDEYREIFRSRLLRSKLSAVIGEEKVIDTEEQVHARHIMLAVTEPNAAVSAGAEGVADTHGPYPDAEALALANELRSRILSGEDLAALARAYSDDTGSGANGGDLGWFGKGRMVAPFEEAAFSLPLNEVSEPVKTDFGYHLIEVLEKDPAKPKDEAQLQQERAQAFQTWLGEQIVGNQVKRAGDLLDFMPPGARDEGNVTPGTGLSANSGDRQTSVVEPDVPADWIDGTALGDPHAPVEVQIWVDFLCPSCQVFAGLVEPQLVEQYVKPGKIRLTLHYFPLQQYDPEATLTALAAACAGEQNRFWPYHWYLMAMIRQAGQEATTVEALNTYASEVGLNADVFQSCLAEKKPAGVVAVDVAKAQAIGLQFVPSVIVGDTLLQDSSFEGVKGVIESQLH